MVGDDGVGNQIGVAPGAKWIAARAYSTGGALGSLSTLMEALQWMLAPTDLAGMNPDPSKAPHAINNSWGCPPGAGCTDPLVLLPVTQNLRAAGIVVIHSAGNDGPSCNTIVHPSKIYDEVITVGGSVQNNDDIWPSSARGPSFVNSVELVKPDVVAPVEGLRSAALGGGYITVGATSYAAPHVGGEVALLISGFPALSGHVGSIENMIFASTVQKTTTQNCGSVPGAEVPNNTYGWGRIDCYAALTLASSSVSAPVSQEAWAFTLQPNEPNPFTGSTRIRYELHRATSVRLTVYDVTGRLVRTLEETSRKEPGAYSVDWDGRDQEGRSVAAGAYFYRLAADEGRTASNRLIFLK
jgi:subtilisin family serine protease